jgi:outer membrane protein TolC
MPHPILTEPLPEFPAVADEAIREALQARPDLGRLEKLRLQQELESELANNDLLPRLDLQTYVARDFGGGDPNRDETELRLGIRFEVPLQTRGQDGRKVQALARAAEARYQSRNLSDRIAVELRDIINAAQIARERLAIARDELALSRRLEDGERTKFSLGDSSLIFVNLREQTTADAAIREIDVLLELQRLWIMYRAALGSAS